MKLYLKSYIAALLMIPAAALVSSCSEELDQPPLDIPQTDWKANTTILDLKTTYWQDDRNYALQITPAVSGERIIIGGRVIASDSTGNIYKTVILQDSTAAVTIAVDTTKLYLRYKQGEQMYMDVTNLFVGKYNGLMQIGDRQAYGTGYETSQLSGKVFYDRTRLNGLPDQAYVDTLHTTIAEIKSWRTPAQIIPHVSQLIQLDDVSFVGGGSLTYSDFGTSSNRELADAYGNTLVVRNSAYATFAQDVMPAGYGTVVCILSYYGTDWQLLLRSAVDVYGFSGSAGDVPESIKAVCRKSSTISSGDQAVLVGPGNGVVVPVAASSNYGYLTTQDPLAVDGDLITARKSSLFTFDNTEQGWTIRDSYGRYLSLEGSYASFQMYSDAPREGSYWDITVAQDGALTVSSRFRSGAVIRWADNYSNFAVTGSGVLPILYTLTK